MTSKIKGLDDIEKKIHQLSQNAEQVSGTHSYKFDEVFPTIFMTQHSDFDDISSFLLASPEHISNQEELESASDEILDRFVSEQTDFSSWQDMFETASKELLIRKLGF